VGNINQVPADFGRKCGIYFLVKNEEIIYIGQSVDIFVRCYTHANGIKFDSALFFECTASNLDMLEKQFIFRYQPIKNKSTPNFLCDPSPEMEIIINGVIMQLNEIGCRAPKFDKVPRFITLDEICREYKVRITDGSKLMRQCGVSIFRVNDSECVDFELADAVFKEYECFREFMREKHLQQRAAANG
jgi:hypothetical protein